MTNVFGHITLWFFDEFLFCQYLYIYVTVHLIFLKTSEVLIFKPSGFFQIFKKFFLIFDWSTRIRVFSIYAELSLLSEYFDYGSAWMSIVVNVTMFVENLAAQIWVLLSKGLGHVSIRVSVYINFFVNEEKVLKAWFVNTIVHSLGCLRWIICYILVSDL